MSITEELQDCEIHTCKELEFGVDRCRFVFDWKPLPATISLCWSTPQSQEPRNLSLEWWDSETFILSHCFSKKDSPRTSPISPPKPKVILSSKQTELTQGVVLLFLLCCLLVQCHSSKALHHSNYASDWTDRAILSMHFDNACKVSIPVFSLL